jgi:hypothetical protein
MKPITTLLVTVLAALFLAACSQEPAPAEKTEQPAVQTPQPAALPSQPMAETAEQKMQEGATAVKQGAEAVEQKVEQGAEAVKQEVEQGAVAIKQDVSEVAGQVKMAAGAVTEKAHETVAQVMPEEKPAGTATSSSATGPVMVSYEASMGKVTFNHAEHSGRFDCSRCHTTDPPQKIAIDKEVAHNQLCKVCHKELGGNAPTACAGCHKK